MRVRFLQSFDWVTARRKNGTPRAMQSFPAGIEATVTRDCGAEAIAAGKAVDLKADPDAKPDAAQEPDGV